mmetsp:Transcript_127216/g.231160  ORF Transcript_127216/g.231160 Transcript_127216/m.231160 type:complete len:357 (-) Transcript_127216:111-1181(-)
MAYKRIQKELSQFDSEQPGGCSVWPVEGDLFHLQGTVTGLEGTPFEGGNFGIELFLPSDYPFKGPKGVRFTTPIWHSHFPDGRVQMPIEWSPKEKIVDIFAYIRRAMLDQCSIPAFADRIVRDDHRWRCSPTGELELSVKYMGGYKTFTFRAAESDLVENIKGECHDRCCVGPNWMTGTQLHCGGQRLEDGRALRDYPEVVAKIKQGVPLYHTAKLRGILLPEETEAGRQLAKDEAGYFEKARLWTEQHARSKVITLECAPSGSGQQELVCTTLGGDETRFLTDDVSCDSLGTFQQRLATHYNVPLQQLELILSDGTLVGGRETRKSEPLMSIIPCLAAWCVSSQADELHEMDVNS